MSVHALRFYEQEGPFVNAVRRGPGGRRIYCQDDVEWLNVCIILRASGMPLTVLRRYADLVREGAGNAEERLALMREHQERVTAQIGSLTESLDLIRFKVGVYEFLVSQGDAAVRQCHGPSLPPGEARTPGLRHEAMVEYPAPRTFAPRSPHRNASPSIGGSASSEGLAESRFFADGFTGKNTLLAQTAGRWTRLGVEPFHRRDGASRRHWRSLIKSTERQLVPAEHRPGMLTDLEDYLFERTTGPIGAYFTLLVCGCYRAIRTGSEALTRDLLDHVRLDEASEQARHQLPGSAPSRPARGAAS